MPCEFPTNFKCPVEFQSEQLLTDFREFRAEFREFREQIADWREDNVQRLKELEVKSKDICGNGRQGRMGDAEDNIEILMRWRVWMLGLAAGVSSLVGVAFHYLPTLGGK